MKTLPFVTLLVAVWLVCMPVRADESLDLRPVEEQLAEQQAQQVHTDHKAAPYARGTMEFGGSLGFYYSQSGALRKTYSAMVDPRAHFYVARGWYLRPMTAFRGIYNQDTHDEQVQEFLFGAGGGYAFWQLGGGLIPSVSLCAGGVMDRLTRENNFNSDDVDRLLGAYVQPSVELRIAVGSWTLMPALNYSVARVSGEDRNGPIVGRLQHRMDVGVALLGRRTPAP